MKARMAVWLVVLLWPLQAWSLGYVYAGVGGGGRDRLELTSVTVDVNIQDRVAVTRMDQVFTNQSDSQLEGIYEFRLPRGAIITDLVLWIGDRRIHGVIMEKEEARQAYDSIVNRHVDPALIEYIGDDLFRLSIFPFPGKGSRRVELEYLQLLESRRGVMEYSFPLAPEQGQPAQMELFLLQAAVRGQHSFEVAVTGAFQDITDIQQVDERSVDVLFGDEKVSPELDFELTISETSEERLPTVLSFAPRGESSEGYYALWLPPLQELARSDPIPRSLTFVIDISSSMQGDKLDAVKGALTVAIEDLHSDDSFNIIVFSTRAAAFAQSPVAATAQNQADAVDFVRAQGAVGLTNFEAALESALEQTFPGEALNHLVFLTDGNPTVGEQDLLRLGQTVEDLSPEGVRIFTIGVGDDVNRNFLRALAEDHRGSSSFLSDEADIETTLRALFEEFTRPIFLPESLVFDGVATEDVYPRGVELLAVGQELLQVGRYEGGGAFTLRLHGRVQDSALTMEYPLEFSSADTTQRLIPRLWAHQKVQALEGEISRFGAQEELLNDILDLGLRYRLVTRMTSLFAPDEEVIVNPTEDMVDWGELTAVEETAVTASWLGKTFHLRNDIWIDADFRTGTPVREYDPRGGHPGALADFASLGENMVVVLEGTAYEVRQGMLPTQPVLLQNAPNPFNASTVIPYQIPVAMAGETAHLAIYNSAGQQVRVLVHGALEAGPHSAHWDGRDDGGRDLATGVYLYRLEAGGWVQTRRLLLVR